MTVRRFPGFPFFLILSHLRLSIFLQRNLSPSSQLNFHLPFFFVRPEFLQFVNRLPFVAVQTLDSGYVVTISLILFHYGSLPLFYSEIRALGSSPFGLFAFSLLQPRSSCFFELARREQRDPFVFASIFSFQWHLSF